MYTYFFLFFSDSLIASKSSFSELKYFLVTQIIISSLVLSHKLQISTYIYWLALKSNIKIAVCCGSTGKCLLPDPGPKQAHTFECLVSSRWYHVGR